jgi:Spy/CpxP family protein refolding chaperone
MMRGCVLTGLLALGLAAWPSLAQEQQRQKKGRGFGFVGFGGGQLGLLAQKSVQEELKLSDEQIKKAAELQEKQRGSFKDFQGKSREEIVKLLQQRSQETDKALSAFLKPDQHARLKQISLQLRGSMAFADPMVADALGLSAEQKEKLETLRRETGEAARALFQGGFNDETRKKLAELRQNANDKAINVLTSEQQAKWKQMTGEPFKGEIVRRRPQGS